MEKTAEEKKEQELELVRDVLSYDVRHRDLDCNERVMLDALAGQSMDFDTVAATYYKIRDSLVESPIWTEALVALKAAHPEWLYGEAVLQLIVEAWANLFRDYECSGDGLIRLAEGLNQKAAFPLTQEYTEARRRERHRVALIQAISQGKSTYSCVGNNDSRIVNYKSVELAAETDERLQEILDIVTEYRRLSSMSVDEIKKQRRLDEIAKGRAQNLSLPSHWIPDHDGQNRNTGAQIKAGVQVELSADVIKRLHRDDLVKLTRSYGADLVNARLGVKPAIQYGNVQVIRG